MTHPEAGSLDTPQQAGEGDAARVAYWNAQLDLADEEEKGWRDAADIAVKRFRDEDLVGKGSIKGRTPGSKFNILRANVRVLGGAIYQTQPKPDIRRRFAQKDVVGKTVAEVLERACTYMLDEYDFHGAMKLAVHSMLVPGRGVTRIEYQPELTEGGVAWQKVCPKHVQWRDFRRGPGRTWDEVSWIAFKHYPTKEEVERNFPGIDITRLTTVTVDRGQKDDKDDKAPYQDVLKRYLIWEVWDKDNRRIEWISPAYEYGPLKVEEDPLQLVGFFPIPRPLYALDQDDSLIPVEDFRAYRDQAAELDNITGRITKIVSAIKVRGIYDSTMKEVARLQGADDGELIPSTNSTPIMQQGGFERAIWIWPIEMLAKVLDSLYTQREQIKQTIYEITGISDIFRGTTDAQETLGAQQLKAQNGAVSISDRRDNVARYARDIVRIMAEIISQQFEPEILQQMTGVELPTAEMKAQAQAAMQQGMELPPEAQELLTKPTWDEVIQILRSDQLRSYRVGIETDSTVAGDAQRDQENVAKLLEGVSGFMTAIIPAMQTGIIQPPVAQSMLASISRRFKLGREVEDALDEMSETMGQAQGGLSPEEAQQMQVQMQEQGAQMEQASQEMAAKEQEIAQREAALESQAKLVAAETKAQQAEAKAALAEQYATQQTELLNMKPQPSQNILMNAEGVGSSITEQVETIRQPIEQLAIVMAQTLQQIAQANAANQEQMQQLMAVLAAPTVAERGPNGEIVGARKVLN